MALGLKYLLLFGCVTALGANQKRIEHVVLVILENRLVQEVPVPPWCMNNICSFLKKWGREVANAQTSDDRFM